MNSSRATVPRRASVGSVLLMMVAGGLVLGPAQAARGGNPNEKQPTAGRCVRFAPGVRIDFDALVVELDAAIVLREGMLELFACSPHTREHESILVIPARPLHIFQAMGLVGLEPGSPVRYDEKTGKWHPADGERLKLEVRYPHKGQTRRIPAAHWLYDINSARELSALGWVFAGSRTFGQDQKFAADAEGTIVSVVDFDTALISLDTMHSDSNAELWLQANTESIPPRGTKCTLLLSSATKGRLLIEVNREGKMFKGGAPIEAKQVSKLCKRGSSDSEGTIILLRPVGGASAKTLAAVMDELVKAGIDRQSIRTPETPTKRAVDGP